VSSHFIFVSIKYNISRRYNSSQLKVGEFVVVKERKSFCRAKIIDKLPVISSNKISVFLIDDGIICDVDIDKILSFPIRDNVPNPNRISDQILLPECSFPCRLFGLLPSANQDRYSSHASVYFDAFADNRIEVTIEVAENYCRVKPDIVSVNIRSNSNLLNELVDRELAVRVNEDTFESDDWITPLNQKEKIIIGIGQLERQAIAVPYAATNGPIKVLNQSLI